MALTSRPDSFVFLFSRLQEEVNRLLNEFVESTQSGAHGAGWFPNVDVVETEAAVVVYADAPGIAAEDLRLEVHGATVTLAGEKSAHYPGTPNFQRVERAQGAFKRQIVLDRAVNGAAAKATLTDGVLRIEFPKIEDKRRRTHRIRIAEERLPGPGSPS
jgi:HSP20 family protein